MPKKKWIVASAALAAVKGKKKLSDKKKSSFDEYSDSDSSLSSDSKEEHHYRQSGDTNSYHSSSHCCSAGSAELLSDGSESNDYSSSSYGCGTYHRRESLSQSSSSSLSSDKSSVLSSYDSSQLSGFCSELNELPPESAHFPESVSGAELEIDEESESSSKVCKNKRISSYSIKPTATCNSLMHDDEQRRRLLMGGRGKGRRGDLENGECAQPEEEKFSNLLERAKYQKLANHEDFLEEQQENRDAEEKFNALLERVRSQSTTVKSEASSSFVGVGCIIGTNVESTQKQLSETSTASENRDAGGELSYSLKTELLANANSNLRSSVTSIASEESVDSQNDDSSKKSVGSSRFASMMANLKSSNEVHCYVESKPNSSFSNEISTESDDEHIFEAPKIVNERGQSMRCLTSHEVSFASVLSEDSSRGKKIYEDEEEGKRSRFRVRRPSLRQTSRGKCDKSSEIIRGEEQSETGKQSSVEIDINEHSDDESASTASSGEDQNSRPVNNHTRLRYPDDDENSSDEDIEYYGEPAMTILTPITEMGSMESDVETSSHSDESGTDSNDTCPIKAEEKTRRAKQQNECSSNIIEVIKRVRLNDPDLKQINLDNKGLKDIEVAKLLYLLNENSHISHVSLANNKLGDGSAVSLAQVLISSQTITVVCLRGNNIGNRGALALKRVTKFNNTLTHVDLNGNDVDSYVMESLHKSSATFVPLQEVSPHNIIDKEDITGFLENSEEKVDTTERNPCDCLETKITVNAYALIRFYDEKCVVNGNKNQTTFRKHFSFAQKSETKTCDDVALLLAMSLALAVVDSSWLLKGISVGGSPIRSHSLLGDRGRIFVFERLDCSSSTHAPNSNRISKRKASRSLQHMTHCRWKESMLKASKLRKGLLCFNQQNMIKESINCASFSTQTLGKKQKLQQWASSFKKLDPRWQIRKFFNDMSAFGTILNDATQSEAGAIFSVWRPTSADAIAKMMQGNGVGKGLEIKGKSAKKGDLSGYIPFLQIHHEEHKKYIRTLPKGDRTKIFFRSDTMRNRVGEYLGKVAKELTLRVVQAKFLLARAKFGCDPKAILREELNYAAKSLAYELDNPMVVKNDEYAPEMYSIEVSCRVLWEGLVERKDITREPDSKFDSGRASQPAFQDMNFAALRRQNYDEALPVLYQTSDNDPFDARMIVMAYEEEGKVVPVVSDFDCFLIGSKNFFYEDKLAPEQVDLLDWCVSQIEWILDNHTCPESWTTCWLKVLKYAARNGFYPSMPRFGFGDPTSYSLIEASVHRSAKTCGAVRHGPECFNYFFPQDIDEEFLIIFPGDQMWKYVSEKELLSILRKKIYEGFTFPLNPKWLLCDPGWMSLFQELLHSNHTGVKKSIDLWFPPESGLRERIFDINLRYPNGFLSDRHVLNPSLAEEQYERYLILERARRKIRGFIYWRNLLLDVRQRAMSSIDDNCLSTVDEYSFLFHGKKKQLSKANDIEDETLKEIGKVSFFHG